MQSIQELVKLRTQESPCLRNSEDRSIQTSNQMSTKESIVDISLIPTFKPQLEDVE